MINVTKTYLPNKQKYQQHVDEIFNSNWITNYGSKVQCLEKRLAEYLGVKNLILVANGTVALEIAYRTLNIKNHVITTPFSFVATTSSIVTNGLKPIYADINPETLNICTENIKKAITANTTAIVPVHVFGNPCDVDEIDIIAKNNNLKVIYDAAHAFDVKYNNNSVLNYGNISTLSFHATKLFHTIEGGALIVKDDNLVEKARHLINFGIENEESIPSLGTNAKMNEFEAAMGLCVLDEIQHIKKKRKRLYNNYKEGLKRVIQFQRHDINSTYNYSYFCILPVDENQRISIQSALNKNNIFPRRYFYPSLDTLNYIQPKQYMPNSRYISNKILCLPLYPGLSDEDQSKIIRIINEVCNE